jgi:hypothetical protein
LGGGNNGVQVTTMVHAAARPVGQEPAVPFVLLKDWKPLTESVPRWRHFVGANPMLKAMFALDCGGGGDCLFHVLAAGYNHLFQKLLFDMQGMRNLTAQQVVALRSEQLDEFLIDLYGRKPDAVRNWTAENKAAYLQSLIRRPGNSYWGETGTLRQLLLHHPAFRDYGIGFAVVSIRSKPIAFRAISDHESSAYVASGKQPPSTVAAKWEPRVEITVIRTKQTRFLLFMHCLENAHWVLLGYAPAILSHQQVPAKGQFQSRAPQNSMPVARVASTFPLDSFPRPIHPFLREPA